MITQGWVRITAWAAGLVAAAAVFYIIHLLYVPFFKPILDVLLPFSVAVALALLLDPTIQRLTRRGIPRPLATALVAIIFIATFVILAIFLIPILIYQAKELANNWTDYTVAAQKYINDLMVQNEGLLRRFHLPTTMPELTSTLSTQAQDATGNALAWFGALLGRIASNAFWLIIIPITTIFILMDADKFKAKTLLLVPIKYRESTAELANSIGRVFGAYIRGLLTLAAMYGTACGIAIALWGVPYAVILGAAAGVLSLVPYIGTITTLLLVALVTLVTKSANPIQALWVTLTILALNQLFDNIVNPKLVGKAVGLHPALAILALLIGASMFGIVGMILAVPVAASIQIVVLEFYPELKKPEETERKRRLSIWTRLFGRLARKPAKSD